MGKQLEPASDVAAAALEPQREERVLDVGCGSGNAGLAMARRGAHVTLLDPSRRLLEVAKERLTGAGFVVDAVEGDAMKLPFEDGAFDRAISVFALIFAPDAHVAGAELTRVVRPGGRLVMTSWRTEGAIHEVGKAAMEAAATKMPEVTERASMRWGDEDFVRDVFAGTGAISVTEHQLKQTAASAEAWFDEVERTHPVWLAIGELVGIDSDTWKAARERSLDALRKGNEADNGSFAVSTKYLVIQVDRCDP